MLTNLLPAFYWIWTLYILVLVILILLEKRSPVSTVAWILSLSLLPILGLVIYFLFGPKKIKRQKASRTFSKDFIQRVRDIWIPRMGEQILPEEHLYISRLITTCTNTVPTYATKYEVLRGGEKTYDTLFAEIEKAKKYVLLEYYIFATDEVGQQLRDLLTKKQKEGVQIYLLVDTLGSYTLRRSFLKDLIQAGGHVDYFHNLSYFSFLSVINFRNHRKIVICDGEVAFTGGVNISRKQDLRLTKKAFHDVHIRLEGPVVNWLEMVFAEDWHYSTRKNSPLLFKMLKENSDLQLKNQVSVKTAHSLTPQHTGLPYPMQLIPSGPDNDLAPVLRAMIASMYRAKKRIYLTTPYFVPDEGALMALSSASMRGVDVKLLVPEKPDNFIVSKASQSWYEDLINMGIQVYEFGPRMIHTKTLIIDDEISFIGSSNFDYRSFYLNFELMLICFDKEINRSLADDFYQSLEHSKLAEITDKSFLQRLTKATARVFSPIL